MGFKACIHGLHEPTDLSVLVTEELHQNFTVDGFKRKNLETLFDTFSQFSYRPILHYKPVSGWDIQKSGRLVSHLQAPNCIPLRLEPVNQSTSEKDNDLFMTTSEMAIQSGQHFFGSKFESLKSKIPDDWQHVCEYIGRLMPMYKDANFIKWQWYLCAKSGTALNFHLMPETIIDPSFFLQAKADCRRARINTVHVYPYTVEIIFHAYTKIERLPFNRRHRLRYEPYAKR